MPFSSIEILEEFVSSAEIHRKWTADEYLNSQRQKRLARGREYAKWYSQHPDRKAFRKVYMREFMRRYRLEKEGYKEAHRKTELARYYAKKTNTKCQ